jgi:hypothetical protein
MKIVLVMGKGMLCIFVRKMEFLYLNEIKKKKKKKKYKKKKPVETTDDFPRVCTGGQTPANSPPKRRR